MGSPKNQTTAPNLRYIPLSYSPADSQSSALRLILTLFPDWEGPNNKIEFVRFTDGITNTVRFFFPPRPPPCWTVPSPEGLSDKLVLTFAILQLLKIINRKPGLTDEEVDNDAVLMRAYGNGTEILIDRESMKTQAPPGLTSLRSILLPRVFLFNPRRPCCPLRQFC